MNFLQLKEVAIRTNMVELNHESFYKKDLAYAVDVGSLMFPILFPYINFSREISLVVPVTIRAASSCIFSSSFSSYFVRLHQTISAYSNMGRIKAI